MKRSSMLFVWAALEACLAVAPAPGGAQTALTRLERAASSAGEAARTPDLAGAFTGAREGFETAAVQASEYAAAGRAASISPPGTVPAFSPHPGGAFALAGPVPVPATGEVAGWGPRALKLAGGIALAALGAAVFLSPPLVPVIGLGLVAAGGAGILYGLAAGDDKAGLGGFGLAVLGGLSFIPVFGPVYLGVILAFGGMSLAVSAFTERN